MSQIRIPLWNTSVALGDVSDLRVSSARGGFIVTGTDANETTQYVAFGLLTGFLFWTPNDMAACVFVNSSVAHEVAKSWNRQL